MPPTQCPECGRFLKDALVAALEHEPQPCPGCGIELTAAMLAEGATEPDDAAPAEPTDTTEPAGDVPAEQGGDRAGAPSSVRPPDLSPRAVREVGTDALDGWDIGVDPSEVAAWRRDDRPFPTDTVVVLAGGAAGALLGGGLWARHRVSGAAIGALAGLVVAAVSRRIWRLEG